MGHRSPLPSSAISPSQGKLFARVRALLFLVAVVVLGGCSGGSGGMHNGTGPLNQLIDLTSDVTVDNQPDGPNLTFSDGAKHTLNFMVSNSGDKPSDQLITVTVTLPSGISFVSYASVTPGSWTCTVSGQTITCASSTPVPVLSSAIPIFTVTVSVASTASGNEQLFASIYTADGSPTTSSGAKGVNFTAAVANISSLNPTSGTGGTAVTISGSNFGASQGSSTVTFNGQNATTITSWSATSVVVDVPAGTPEGAGPVVVTVGGVASNAVTFTVTGPQITGLSPNSGPIGTAVTISGSNFGSSQGAVAFNGVMASTIASWSNTSIVADVPLGAATGNVVVTADGIASTTSSSTMFTVTGSGGCPSGGSAASLLTGDYAFSGQGLVGGNRFYAVAGRFHADGGNTIYNGLIDQNEIGSSLTNGTPLTFDGCFVLNTPAGASGVALGTMTIVNSSASLAMTLSIAIRANGDGNFITYDATSPQLSGVLEKQCPNAANGSCPAFANSNVSGGYGFAFDGVIPGSGGSNYGVVGRVTADGSKNAPGEVDISSYAGAIAFDALVVATFNVTDTTYGRAVITASFTYNNGGASGTAVVFHFACYLADINGSGVATFLHCMTTDLATQAPLPLLLGRFVTQTTPSAGWTNTKAAPASNASVMWSTGDASVDLGQLTYNTTANPAAVTISQDQNYGGSYSVQQVTEDIIVAPDGRMQISPSGSLLVAGVCYIIDPGKGFCINESNNAALIYLNAQQAAPSGGFTAANLDNSFALGTLNPIAGGVTDAVLTSTGSTGTFSGQENSNSTSGLLSSPFAGTYSIAPGSDAAIGRYTVAVTSPAADTWALYLIDANTAVAMSTTATEPVVLYLNY